MAVAPEQIELSFPQNYSQCSFCEEHKMRTTYPYRFQCGKLHYSHDICYTGYMNGSGSRTCPICRGAPLVLEAVKPEFKMHTGNVVVYRSAAHIEEAPFCLRHGFLLLCSIAFVIGLCIGLFARKNKE